MAIRDGYVSYGTDTRFGEKLTNIFRVAIADNKNFRNLRDIKAVTNWYSEVREYRREKAHVILSMVMNRIIGKLVEYTEPFYTDSLVKKIGIETEFKDGSVQTNFEIKFTPLEPYVEFIKKVNGNKVSSTKFKFRLETTTYMKKLRILSRYDGKSICIEKLGFNLELSLVQIIAAINYLSRPIKLANKKFEIKDISFNLRR